MDAIRETIEPRAHSEHEGIKYYNIKKPTIMQWLKHIYITYFFLQSVFVTLNCWSEWSFITRISSIETINFTLFMFIVSNECHIITRFQATVRSIFMSEHACLKTFKAPASQHYIRLKKDLVDRLKKQRTKVIEISRTSAKYLFSSHNITSILSIILYMTNHIENVQDMPLPFISYNLATSSNVCNNLSQYIIYASMQTVYLMVSFGILIEIYLSSMASCSNLRTEMELFVISVREFDSACDDDDDVINCQGRMNDNICRQGRENDDIYHQGQRNDNIYRQGQTNDDIYHQGQRNDNIYRQGRKNDDFHHQGQRNDIYHRGQRNDIYCQGHEDGERSQGHNDSIGYQGSNYSYSSRRSMLHIFTRNLVKQHQMISRKIGMFVDGLRLEIIYVNVFICVQISLAVFCFQRTESIIFKIKYGFVVLSTIILCFVYSEESQILCDKFDDMATSLFHSSWADKPIWIQRSLIILITRNTKTPVIGISDIVTTNRSHVKTITQAAYSYLNFLSRIVGK